MIRVNIIVMVAYYFTLGDPLKDQIYRFFALIWRVGFQIRVKEGVYFHMACWVSIRVKGEVYFHMACLVSN